MPDINGLELIRFVKTNPLYKDIPLIIVTTERGEEDRKKGMSPWCLCLYNKSLSRQRS
jgi:two-component system chemotaxis response regulator CheY